MPIVFHCYAGTHSSVTAAAIYLGLLPRDRPPTREELLALPAFDSARPIDRGTFRFMGRDRCGRRVFVVGWQEVAPLVRPLVAQVARCLGSDRTDLTFINALPAVNFRMMVGGYTSRVLGWVDTGRPLVLEGTRRAFPILRRIVDEAEAALATMPAEDRSLPWDGRRRKVLIAGNRGLLPPSLHGIRHTVTWFRSPREEHLVCVIPKQPRLLASSLESLPTLLGLEEGTVQTRLLLPDDRGRMERPSWRMTEESGHPGRKGA